MWLCSHSADAWFQLFNAKCNSSEANWDFSVKGNLNHIHTLPLFPTPLTASSPPRKSVCFEHAHLHSSNWHSEADTYGAIVAVCASFSRFGAFSSHHLTLWVAWVSMLKPKKKTHPSYSLAYSDSRCCILMWRVSQGGEMRKSSPITQCPPAGQGQGLQQPDRWYCHPLLTQSKTHTHTMV